MRPPPQPGAPRGPPEAASRTAAVPDPLRTIVLRSRDESRSVRLAAPRDACSHHCDRTEGERSWGHVTDDSQTLRSPDRRGSGRRGDPRRGRQRPRRLIRSASGQPHRYGCRYDRGCHRCERESRTMDCDVAVLGGGPGGYTAAIRAAQLGARTICIEQEPELGGTCLRNGCMPTKAWVQTAHAIKDAEETFAKLGVHVGEPMLDMAAANAWKEGVSKQMTSGVASLFKAFGVEWVRGVGRFKDANTIAVEGREDVTFKSAIVATGSYPLWPPIPGLDSPRCVDSTGLLAQESVPRRLVILGGGIIGCEFASIFNRFGSEVTIIEMLDSLIPQEDAEAAKELAKQFGKRGITLQLGKQCTEVRDDGSSLTVTFGP